MSEMFSWLIFSAFCYRQKQPPEVFCKKKVFLEISQNSQEKTYRRVSFFEKVAGHLRPTAYTSYVFDKDTFKAIESISLTQYNKIIKTCTDQI